MKILIACEESQRVCIEFRKRGHEAYSCDIVDCSGGHPEWHIQDDVIPLLNGSCKFKTADGLQHQVPGRWDMIIAFPPCTHLAVSGAAHFKKKRADGRQQEGIEFFCRFLAADCDRVVIENPIGIISGTYIPEWFPDIAAKYNLPVKPSQIVQPWQFGDNAGKSTCLWIKGLPHLVPQITVRPPVEYHEWVGKDGRKKRQELWFYETRCLPHKDRGRMASKTFPGIAQAMAEQWG